MPCRSSCRDLCGAEWTASGTRGLAPEGAGRWSLRVTFPGATGRCLGVWAGAAFLDVLLRLVLQVSHQCLGMEAAHATIRSRERRWTSGPVHCSCPAGFFGTMISKTTRTHLPQIRSSTPPKPRPFTSFDSGGLLCLTQKHTNPSTGTRSTSG